MKKWKQEYLDLLFSHSLSIMEFNKANELKYQHMPKKFYKFCRFDDEGYNTNNLISNRVWMSDPKKFNDPYDCALSFDFEKVSNVFFRKNIDSIFSELNISFTDDEKGQIRNSSNVFKEMLIVTGKKYNNKHYSTDESVIDSFYKLVSKRTEKFASFLNSLAQFGTFVSSFSESNNSLLMWGHYAEKHTGFCIEYDFKSLGIDNPLSCNIYPIIYSNEIPDVSDYILSFPKKLSNSIFTLLGVLTKAKYWEYEKEWRLISAFGCMERESPVTVPTPTAIYLGSKISQDKEDLMLSISRSMNVSIYKAEIHNNRFKLIFREIKKEGSLK